MFVIPPYVHLYLYKNSCVHTLAPERLSLQYNLEFSLRRILWYSIFCCELPFFSNPVTIMKLISHSKLDLWEYTITHVW